MYTIITNMFNKYQVEYNIKILSYNIYYKSMLGLDEKFLPQKLAQNNVKNVIDNNYDIIALQEVQCIDKIIEKKNRQLIIGKSGRETLVTIFNNNFKIINSITTEFCKGRGIQITQINYIDKIWIVVNIHAPHYYNNFGNYIGEKIINMKEYNQEFKYILSNVLETFINNHNIQFNRILIMGDFNEAFADTNTFILNLNNINYEMKTYYIKPRTCCYDIEESSLKTGDLIYDSNNSNMLNIPYVNFPASDHLPVETTIN